MIYARCAYSPACIFSQCKYNHMTYQYKITPSHSTVQKRSQICAILCSFFAQMHLLCKNFPNHFSYYKLFQRYFVGMLYAISLGRALLFSALSPRPGIKRFLLSLPAGPPPSPSGFSPFLRTDQASVCSARVRDGATLERKCRTLLSLLPIKHVIYTR